MIWLIPAGIAALVLLLFLLLFRERTPAIVKESALPYNPTPSLAEAT